MWLGGTDPTSTAAGHQQSCSLILPTNSKEMKPYSTIDNTVQMITNLGYDVILEAVNHHGIRFVSAIIRRCLPPSPARPDIGDYAAHLVVQSSGGSSV